LDYYITNTTNTNTMGVIHQQLTGILLPQHPLYYHPLIIRLIISMVLRRDVMYHPVQFHPHHHTMYWLCWYVELAMMMMMVEVIRIIEQL